MIKVSPERDSGIHLMRRQNRISVGVSLRAFLLKANMARARNIKPGFFKNEDLGTADPFVSLLFAGLWTLADKAGILEDRPLRIKAELFPYRDNFDINGYLTVLVSFKLIHRYEVNGLKLIQVVKFKEHQNPHHTEKDSEYPEYTEGCQVTVIAPLKNGLTPADSLIPDSVIPDSLNTDSLITDSPSADKSATKSPFKLLLELGVAEQHAKDWLTIRKAKRAPLTRTALYDLIREAGKAGISVDEAVKICCKRSWQGFNADWLKSNKSSGRDFDAELRDFLGTDNIIEGESKHVG